jgi:hypothetical protein
VTWTKIKGGVSATLRHVGSGELATIVLRKEPVQGKQWAIWYSPDCYSVLRNYRTDQPHTGSLADAKLFAEHRLLSGGYETVGGQTP